MATSMAFDPHRPVSDIMTSDLVTVHEDTIMTEVNLIFEKNDFHHLLVTRKDNELAGIISRQDLELLKSWSSKLGLGQAQRDNSFLLRSRLANEVMTANVVSITPDHTLQQCADILKENAFRALPILKNGKIVGLITMYDLMCYAYQ